MPAAVTCVSFGSYHQRLSTIRPVWENSREIRTHGEPSWGPNAWGIDSYELRDISIRVYARAAVVSGRAMVKTNASNPGGTGPYRVTNTYILYDGRWRCVASHNSSLFDQPASAPVFQDIPIIPLLPHPQSGPITSPG